MFAANNPVRLGFVGAGQHLRAMFYPALHFVPGEAVALHVVDSTFNLALVTRHSRFRGSATIP